MGRIVVMNHVTLDGVMQGPGRPGEDTRDGFTHSGWAIRSTNLGDDLATAMSERMTAGGGLKGWLFGRRTYDDLLGHWNEQGGPFKDALNHTPKYVVSSTYPEALPWPNSTRLSGDVAHAVSTLKASVDGVLGIMGSGQLIGSLIAANLIDEYLLFIHPLVLGSGRRLFPDGQHVSLGPARGRISSSGVVIACYEPASA